ncbi:hypothetical protein SAMN05443428_1307 [Caloramator quimbayensis]|uniref:Uncharacterized protein n=1 Tax=Caloramator quimbayensis TaxID=1147123 RepID=A0A1T4Y9S0_9CLOT|nr:hypothetical protein [Caloramator quimbayensis]SKA98584.1 hypothetical protein SAMN05443428_1307 [Caloramator quimbayensis]
MEKHLLSGVSIYMLYPYGKAVGVNTELPMYNSFDIWKRLIRDYKDHDKVKGLLEIGDVRFLGKHLDFPKGVKRPVPNAKNTRETVRNYGEAPTPIQRFYEKHSVTYAARQLSAESYILRDVPYKPYYTNKFNLNQLVYPYGYGWTFIYEVGTRQWLFYEVENNEGKLWSEADYYKWLEHRKKLGLY